MGKFTWGDLTIEQSEIFWDKGVHVEIERLAFDGATISFPIPYDEGADIVKKSVRYLFFFEPFLSSVKINKFETSMLQGELEYQSPSEKEEKNIRFDSSLFSIDVRVTRKDGVLMAEVDSLTSSPMGAKFSGKITAILEDESVEGDFQGVISDYLPLTVKVRTDSNGLSFSGKSRGSFLKIKPVVDLFNLDPEITPWIVDYLSGKSYQLDEFEGLLSWQTPLSLLDTFVAKARVAEAEYVFAKGFEPVKSSLTDVVFENKILKIYPKDATFYRQRCGQKSWLDINFTDPYQPSLTVYLKTTASLNQDLLDLIKFYDLEIPVRQTTGSTVADLQLTVNLQTEEVDAAGHFTVGPSRIQYMGMNLDTHGGVVEIKNSHIKMSDFKFSLGDYLTSWLSGEINASEETGLLEFAVEKVSYPIKGELLQRVNPNKTLSLEYLIRPDGDTIKVAESEWQFRRFKLHLGGFSAPFDYDKLLLTLPSIQVKSSEPALKANLTGTLDITHGTADLDLNITKFTSEILRFDEDQLTLSAKYNGSWDLQIPKESRWIFADRHTILNPLTLTISDSWLNVEKGGITFGDLFKGEVTGLLNTDNLRGELSLENAVLTHPSLGELFTGKKNLSLEMGTTENDIFIRIPELETSFRISPEKLWSLHFRGLEHYLEFSPMLRRLNLVAGDLSLISKSGTLPIDIEGMFFSSYFLVKDDGIDQDLYSLQGTYDEAGFEGEINDNISIKYSDKLEIQSSGISYNIDELTSFVGDIFPEKDETTISNFSMKLWAEDTSLNLREGNVAFADSLYLNMEKGNILLQLKHGTGKAWLSVYEDNLYFSGKDFEDTFVEGLLREARFSGGTLTFSGIGKLDDYEAHFQIDDTVLVDFGLVNNIFAFIDTIPSLFTFSLPNYRAKGMAVSSAILKYKYNNNLFNINTFAIKSNNLNMFGKGTASLGEDTVDMDINLITNAKDNISKIPLVGYVLVGDEQRPSITLKVTGKPDNPDIATSAFKDYLAWPVETVFRAIKLPFGILDKIFSTTQDEFEDGEPVIENPDEWYSE